MFLLSLLPLLLQQFLEKLHFVDDCALNFGAVFDVQQGHFDAFLFPWQVPSHHMVLAQTSVSMVLDSTAVNSAPFSSFNSLPKG
jgi:hypothetical protein